MRFLLHLIVTLTKQTISNALFKERNFWNKVLVFMSLAPGGSWGFKQVISLINVKRFTLQMRC